MKVIGKFFTWFFDSPKVSIISCLVFNFVIMYLSWVKKDPMILMCIFNLGLFYILWEIAND